jgi:hypothetical protein
MNGHEFWLIPDAECWLFPQRVRGKFSRFFKYLSSKANLLASDRASRIRSDAANPYHRCLFTPKVAFSVLEIDEDF